MKKSILIIGGVVLAVAGIAMYKKRQSAAGGTTSEETPAGESLGNRTKDMAAPSSAGTLAKEETRSAISPEAKNKRDDAIMITAYEKAKEAYPETTITARNKRVRYAKDYGIKRGVNYGAWKARQQAAEGSGQTITTTEENGVKTAHVSRATSNKNFSTPAFSDENESFVSQEPLF